MKRGIKLHSIFFHPIAILNLKKTLFCLEKR